MLQKYSILFFKIIVIHNAKHVYQHIMTSIKVKGIQELYPAYTWKNYFLYLLMNYSIFGNFRMPCDLMVHGLIDGTWLAWVKSYSVRLELVYGMYHVKPTALKKAKAIYNFGLSKCNRIKEITKTIYILYH